MENQRDFLPLIVHDKMNFTIKDIYRHPGARGRLKNINDCRASMHSKKLGLALLNNASKYSKYYVHRN